MIAMLAEWAVRAAVLAGLTAALLWVFRVRNVHVRLTVWSAVLAAILLIPAAGRWLPGVPFVIPGEPVPAVQVSAEWESLPIPAPSIKTAMPRHFDAAVAIWLLPALILMARLLAGVWLSRRLVRESRPVRDGFRESERVRVPVTVGLLRPVAVLPADWRSWPEDRLRAVLDHEQAHVLRRDPLRHFLASVYCAICWFHPLAWWLKAQLADLAEAASDDAALAAGGDRVRYAETLMAFFEAARGRVRYEGAAMATPRTRARRIDRVLDARRPPARPPRLAVAAGLVISALALGFVVAAARPVQAEVPPPPAPATQTPKAPQPMCGGERAYRKWLNEDAAYIITREERQRFTEITDRNECDAFIEQFWKRRDPLPETPQNEFKEEHYRRIAYANKRYFEDVPGWRTDRGRIYIQHGPPDEVDAHPAQEVWTYHNEDGGNLTFRFVVREGKYRIETAPHPPAEPAYIFGSPGGLNARLNQDRSLLITLPVDASRGGLHVSGRLVTSDGRNVDSFEGTAPPESRDRYMHWTVARIEPGSYRLSTETKPDAPESVIRRSEIGFLFTESLLQR